MKLKKELKKNSKLNLWTKFLIYVLVVAVPLSTFAQPEPQEGEPQGAFTVVEDQETLEAIGITPGPVWCYNTEANSVIITAPAQERARCELRLLHELEKQATKHELKIGKLQLRIETLTKQHEQIILIKDNEIEELTQAALKRPNENNVWWGVGGAVVGVATTLLIGWMVHSASNGFGR